MVRDVARRIARERPELADLDRDQLNTLARVVIAESLRDDLRHEALLAGVDYPGERAKYLATLARRSANTRRAYLAGIVALELEAARLGISPLALSAAQADDWIASMAGAPATVHLRVAAASAFITWITRRHAGVVNPFRGSRARPALRARRALAVPTATEITAMIAAARPVIRAAVRIMAELGLRVGALPGLVVRGGRFTSTSKGREIAGELSPEALAEISRAGLPLRAPFGELTAGGIAERFGRLTAGLVAQGVIEARYSVHDLRHAFAVRHYTEGRDVYATSKALGHASVTVTERYLKSLGQGVRT